MQVLDESVAGYCFVMGGALEVCTCSLWSAAATDCLSSEAASKSWTEQLSTASSSL